MSSGLHADVSEAIKKHLPQEIGEQLRQRLTALEYVESEYKRLCAAQEGLLANVKILEAKVKQDEDLTKREALIAQLERKLEIDAIQTKLASSYANRLATELKEVVSLVFANNRYKYTESGYHSALLPGAPNCYPTTQQLSTGKTVEGEG